jgi:hypothetical protein
MRDTRRLKTGYFLTETGGYPLEPDKLGYFDAKADDCDKDLVSWSIWEFKSFCITNYTTDY